ncbi:hypothetical protein [Exiguobacterium himgiriensis]|nr:hypothetical protein [Exiguobacterium himgiriensis]MCT4783493.1 hypothetical protein [Exiguobacterium himgiriensis]
MNNRSGRRFFGFSAVRRYNASTEPDMMGQEVIERKNGSGTA